MLQIGAKNFISLSTLELEKTNDIGFMGVPGFLVQCTLT